MPPLLILTDHFFSAKNFYLDILFLKAPDGIMKNALITPYPFSIPLIMTSLIRKLSCLIFTLFTKIYRALIMCFFAWLVGGLFFAIYITRLTPYPAHIPTDGAVVFTGERGRIAHALEFCHQHLCKKIHISGVYPGSHHTESESFPDLSISYDQATDTRENIMYTQEWIRQNHLTSVRLFTSDYHIPRCLFQARQWHITVIPHPLHLAMEDTYRVRVIFREYNKYLLTLAHYIGKKILALRE